MFSKLNASVYFTRCVAQFLNCHVAITNHKSWRVCRTSPYNHHLEFDAEIKGISCSRKRSSNEHTDEYQTSKFTLAMKRWSVVWIWTQQKFLSCNLLLPQFIDKWIITKKLEWIQNSWLKIFQDIRQGKFSRAGFSPPFGNLVLH